MVTQAQLRSKVLSSSEAQRRSITQQQRQDISEQKRKQEEQIKTVQDKVNQTIEQINQGKITEYEQIPTDIRSLINIDKNYFQQQKAIQEANKQVIRDSQFNLAVRVYLGQTKAGTDFKNIPQDIKKQAQEFAESKERGYAKGVQSQVIRQAEQIRQQSLTPQEREKILKTVKIDGSQVSFQARPTASLPKSEVLVSSNVFTSSDPLSIKKASKVEIAPSGWQNFKRTIAEKGLATGTLFYLTEKASSYITERELKNENPYQPYSQGRAVKFIGGTAPYFTPIGGGLLAVTGAEKLIFGGTSYKGQPSELSQEKKELEEKGFSPFFSSAITYGKPVLEIGLGAFGVASQIKTAQTIKAQPQTDFVGTFQQIPEGTGVNILSRTSRGEDSIFTLGSQIIKPVEGTERFYSAGVGYRVAEKEIKPFLSFSSGAERGTGYAVRENSFSKLGGELGQGAIIDKSTALVYRQVGENIYTYQGGQAILRLNKNTGRVSYVVKQPNIKGKLIKAPSPETSSGIQVLFPSTIKKTQFSKTFFELKPQEQELVSSFIAETQKQASKNLPVIESPSISSGFGVGSLPSQEQVRREASQWVGTGLYERTEGGLAPSQTSNILNLQTDKQISFLKAETPTKEKIKGQTRAAEIFKPTDKQVSILKTPQDSRELQRTINLLGAKEVTRQELRNFLQSRTKQPPKENIPKIPPFLIPSKKDKTGQQNKQSIFKVFSRRFGKDRPIFQTRDRGKAEAVLKKELEFTLGRSGQIFEDGKPLALDFGGRFRPSKKDPFRIVEKSKFALSTGGEIKEIQFFKRKKSKSSFF